MDRGLENLIEEVGSLGRFQYLLIATAYLPAILSAWSMMFMVFGIVQPDWWCVSRGAMTNQAAHSFLGSTLSSKSVDILSNYSDGRSSFTNGNVTVSFLTDVRRGDGSDKNQSDVWNTTRACAAVEAKDGTCESIVFAPVMSTIVSELICDLSWVPSLIISIQMVGVLIGATVAGQLADSVGRKTTMVSFTALHAVFNLIAAFSVSWHMFAVLRALIGTTCGGLLVVVLSYPTEFIGVKKRGVVMSMPFWGLGTTTLSLLIWAVPHWSHVQIITAVCSAACLPAWVLFLPESVRWLVVKGHVTKAHRVLCKMAKWNGRKPPNLSSVQVLWSDNDHTQRKYSYHHIFSTGKMMKISLITGSMWFTCSVTYYGSSFGIKNLSGNFNLNFFLLSFVELPFPLFVFHLTRWFGRRWTLFGCFLLSSLTAVAVVPLNLLLSEEVAGNYVNALCIVCRGSLMLGWFAMSLFVAELFPTVVRNIGLGFCNTTARVAGIVSPYILSQTELFLCYSIIGVVMMLTALAPLLLAETRGQPLQDKLFTPSNQKAVDIINRNENETQNELFITSNQHDGAPVDTTNKDETEIAIRNDVEV